MSWLRHILLLVNLPFPGSLIKDLVNNSYPTLVSYAQRIYDQAFEEGHSPIQFTSPSSSLWSLIPSWPKVSDPSGKSKSPEDIYFNRMSWCFISLAVGSLTAYLVLNSSQWWPLDRYYANVMSLFFQPCPSQCLNLSYSNIDPSIASQTLLRFANAAIKALWIFFTINYPLISRAVVAPLMLIIWTSPDYRSIIAMTARLAVCCCIYFLCFNFLCCWLSLLCYSWYTCILCMFMFMSRPWSSPQAFVASTASRFHLVSSWWVSPDIVRVKNRWWRVWCRDAQRVLHNNEGSEILGILKHIGKSTLKVLLKCKPFSLCDRCFQGAENIWWVIFLDMSYWHVTAIRFHLGKGDEWRQCTRRRDSFRVANFATKIQPYILIVS